MKKTLLVAAMLVSLIAGAAAQAAVAAEEPIMKAGSESVTTSDLLYLLGQKAGGNEAVAGMLVSGMSAEEKQSFVREIGDLLLVFQAARLKGIHLDPAVAAKVRWDAVNTIAQAYVEKEAQRWDLSERALRAHFQAHEGDYAVKEAVYVRHILVESEAEARTLMLQVLAGGDFAEMAKKSSKDQGSAEKGGELGWIEKGYTVPAFEDAAFSAAKGGIVGPVKTEYGWHVIQALDKRPASRATFDSVRNQVGQDLQQAYLESHLEKLRNANPVAIDEKKLDDLGKK